MISLSSFGSLAAVDTLFAHHDEVLQSHCVQMMDSMVPTYIDTAGTVTQTALNLQLHPFSQLLCEFRPLAVEFTLRGDTGQYGNYPSPCEAFDLL